MRILTKLLVSSTALVTSALASSIFVDRLQEKKEKQEFEPYGIPVETEFGTMRAVLAGEKGPTIVCLNGYGSPSSYLEFKPLMQELSRFSKVVVLEMLGYGCSDNTDRPRTVHNISEELYAALKSLNIQKCWLMPHSLSGVYSLFFVQQHPEMVEGILAIDPSHPEQIDYFDTDKAMKTKYMLKQTGFLRTMNLFSTETQTGVGYEKEDIELMKKMELWHTHDAVQQDEGNRIKENMQTCRVLDYPNHLPVLMMLASKNVEIFEGWWKELHEKQLSCTNHGKLVILEGTHFLHFTQSAEIAETSRKFIRETLIRKLDELTSQNS